MTAARGKKNPVQIDVEVPRLFNNYRVPGSFCVFSRRIQASEKQIPGHRFSGSFIVNWNWRYRFHLFLNHLNCLPIMRVLVHCAVKFLHPALGVSGFETPQRPQQRFVRRDRQQHAT